jgi:glycosyltransferase involved in cell wall biosynthesis
MAASARTRDLTRTRSGTPVVARVRGLLAPLATLDGAGLALLGLALLTIAWNGVKVGNVSLSYYLLVAAGGALLVSRLRTGPRRPLPGWLWLAGGCVALAATLATLSPPSESYVRSRYVHLTALQRWAGRTETQSDLGNLVKFELCLIGLPLLLVLAGRSTLALRRYADLWVVSGLVSAAVAISDEVGLTNISTGVLGIPSIGRQAGLTISPSHVAVMSAIAIPLAALWLARPGRWRPAGVAALLVLFLGIYVSGSRGGLLAAPVGLVAVACAAPPLRRYATRLLALAVLLAAAWIPYVLLHLRSAKSASSSDYERHHLLLQAGTDIAHSPVFGLGFRIVNQAHDIYLQLLASGGVIALVGFLTLVAGLVVAAREAVRVDRQLGIACAAAIGTWLIIGFVENQLVEPYLYVPVALLVALAGLAARKAAAPEPARVGAGLRIVVHDYSGHPHQAQLSRELARRGHDVLHLHCPAYNSGKGSLTRSPADPPGFVVEPVELEARFEKYAPWKRLRQERRYGRRLVERIAADAPDVVVSSNNPLFAQQRLVRWCRRNGVRFVLWQQDVYGVAMQRGLARRVPVLGGLLGTAFVALERRQLRASDAVVCISDDFRPFVRAAGVPDERVSVIENWAPLDELPQRPRDNAWARRHDLVGRKVLLYAGTLGVKHDPGLLLDLARDLRGDPEARVVVVSEGLGAELLARARADEQLANLVLLDFQPYADLPDLLGAADVLLAVLDDDAGVFSVPSKVLSCHCAGRPILAAVPATNLAARVIEQARSGIVVPPSDPEAFCAAARMLLLDLALRENLGHNAYRYASRTFDIERIGGRFDQIVRAAPPPAARPVASAAISF